MMISPMQTPPPSNDYHPVHAVSNIKNEILMILDRERGQYSNWVELFETYCHACNILDHIDPKTPKPDIFEALWKRLDSIVKKWIYGTISTDLLQTVLYQGATAQESWSLGTGLRPFFRIINIHWRYILKISLILYT